MKYCTSAQYKPTHFVFAVVVLLCWCLQTNPQRQVGLNAWMCMRVHWLTQRRLGSPSPARPLRRTRLQWWLSTTRSKIVCVYYLNIGNSIFTYSQTCVFLCRRTYSGFHLLWQPFWLCFRQHPSLTPEATTTIRRESEVNNRTQR